MSFSLISWALKQEMVNVLRCNLTTLEAQWGVTAFDSVQMLVERGMTSAELYV